MKVSDVACLLHLTYSLLQQAAQMFQFVAIQGMMQKNRKDFTDLVKEGIDVLEVEISNEEEETSHSSYLHKLKAVLESSPYKQTFISRFNAIQLAYALFFNATPLRRNLGAVLIMLLFMVVGIIGVMTFEGWKFIQSLYFCTYALLTVGQEDLTAVSFRGYWFSCCFLPLNVFFLSIYFLLIAWFFAHLDQKNIARIKAKMKAEARIGAVNDGRTEQDGKLERRR